MDLEQRRSQTVDQTLYGRLRDVTMPDANKSNKPELAGQFSPDQTLIAFVCQFSSILIVLFISSA